MAGERAARTAQTRARIKAALVELIGEKGFDALTVSDVTRRAKINRGTFYLHFVDKYDMLDQLEDELIQGLEQTLLANAPADAADACELFPYETLLAALNLVAGDFDFVRAIAGRGGDPDFSSKLKRVIEGLLEQGLARTGTTRRRRAPPRLLARARHQPRALHHRPVARARRHGDARAARAHDRGSKGREPLEPSSACRALD